MKTFVLREREHAARMWDYIKATAQAQADAGRPLVVEISEYDAKGSNEQLRLIWALFTDIAEQVELHGKRFSKEAWYAHYLDIYAPKQEGPSGLIPIGLSQMKKRQRAEFITKVESHAIQELGVEFAALGM